MQQVPVKKVCFFALYTIQYHKKVDNTTRVVAIAIALFLLLCYLFLPFADEIYNKPKKPNNPEKRCIAKARHLQTSRQNFHYRW